MSDENKSSKSLCAQRILIGVLMGLVVALAFRLFYFTSSLPITSDPAAILPRTSALPDYGRIMEMLAPLQYTGVEDLMKPGVDMRINFKEKGWKLTNVHAFDPQGNILLTGDRFGLCGELAAHVYKKIAPFLGDRYEILFLRAAESGFFLRPHSTHIVVMLIDRTTHERFFIDPSFHRYGKEEDFRDYFFFESADLPTHLKSLSKDVLFPVDVETPLLIRKNFLICMGVESVGGKFDKDNFALTLTANKRHAYSGSYIFTLRRQDGKTSILKDATLLAQLLTPEELSRILRRLTAWFDAATHGES